MRRMLLCSVLILPAFAAQAQEAASTDITLPEHVVTATRIPTLAEQIPAGVTVIDRQTIETRGYTTLAEALESVPGLHIVQSGGPGGQASVFIRGTQPYHVLVMRDGVALNDPSDPNGAFDFGVDTLADVERIEVVRGPMSGLYGSGAVGGVINLITRKGRFGPHASVELAGGLPRAGLLGATLSGTEGLVDYSLAAETRSGIGFDITPRRVSTYTGERDGYRSQLATVNLGITPVAGTRFYLFLRYRSSVFGLDDVSGIEYDAPDYTGRDHSFTGRLGVTSKLFDGVWETGLSVAHLDTQRHYTLPLQAANPNIDAYDDRYDGRRTALEWTNTVHLADWGPARASALTFGADHAEDRSITNQNDIYGGYPSVSGFDAHAQHSSGNAGLQTTLFGRLTLTGGLRQENASYGGDAFTWRLGGVLALPEIWSRLKLSYGTAFRAPSLFELFGTGGGAVGNPDLRPERSEGEEVGWAIDLPAFGRRDAATIDATLFANRIRDLITYIITPAGLYSEQNAPSARTSGIEASVTLRPASWAEAVLAWTHTDVSDTGTNAPPLVRRPHNQASASLRATPWPGLTIAPELLYVSGALDYLVDNNGILSYTPAMGKDGLILNLTVSYAVTPHVTLFVDGRNLGDSRYEPASGYQTPGPGFLAGARVKF
jgi:vitamin B12 transporter